MTTNDDARTATPEQPPVWAPTPPPPVSRGRRAMSGLVSVRNIVVGIVALIAIIGGVTRFVNAHRGGASSDGTFTTGDCVTITSTQVRNASCFGAHDGKITAVIHSSSDSCPSGSDEFDVSDGTGNLCVDSSDHSN